MTPPAEATTRDRRTMTEGEAGTSTPLVVVLAWLIPGAGHMMQGQTRRGVIFLVALLAMFALGQGFSGRVFPFQFSDPLVFLAALAQWGIGLPHIVAGIMGWGVGNVTASTYEYGNTFLITSGLLNALVLLDAYDVAVGRRAR